MKASIRWGIMGAGRIAQKFAAAIQYTEGAVLHAVASREPEKGKLFADTWNAAHCYTRYEDLVADPAVDIIYIATPHVFHHAQTLLCLRQGKAVLCEKPLALNYSQTKEMADEARKREIFLMEGMWTRFMPSLNKARELIDAGTIGEVRYIQADFGFAASYNAKGRLYDRALGGGSLLDVGIYPIFLACFFFGEPSDIRAMINKAATGADDYCHALLQYPGGKSAHIFSSIQVDTPKRAEIMGTEGKIVLPTPWYKAEALELEMKDGSRHIYPFPRGCNGFEYEIAEVMECLQNGFSECPAMPLDLTLLMSRVVDEIGRQGGVNY
ncbi:MAG: Gfo/Idh/MocA family oxidoreductase [Bacteroidetes bacterium]|nr:Gfo/Idh/MocA family oxidoreductase [Bacteroidota bacterium]